MQGVSMSPEDYTTLFEWITFTWVYPLIKRVCVTSVFADVVIF